MINNRRFAPWQNGGSLLINVTSIIVTSFHGEYKRMLFHKLIEPRGRKFLFRMQRCAVRHLPVLPIDDKLIKSIGSEQLFDLQILVFALQKDDLHRIGFLL